MRQPMQSVIAPLALVALLCSCNGHDAGAGAAGPAHKARNASAASPGLVAAVSPAGATPSGVQVKYELKARPQVGQPLDVDIVIVPVRDNVERISGKVSAEDGLEIVSGQDIADADKPAQGAPIHHSIQVLPKRDGIFTLLAVLNVDSAGQSTSQAFSMPVIAGAGIPEVASKP